MSAELYKILSKGISIGPTNYTLYFFKYFNYFCQLIWTSSQNTK